MAVDNKLQNKFKKFFDGLYQVNLFLCKILLIGDILITSYAVLGRYTPFIDDPAWSEEIVLTMMVYMAVLSATLAIRKDLHIRMTIFDKYMSERTLLISDIIADAAVCILGVILLVYGIRLCATPLSVIGRYASLPGVSKFWQYASIPVAGISMVVFELEKLAEHISLFMDKAKGEEAKQ